jgi:hypothetical protein
MSRAAEAATGKPSMEVPGDTTDRALVLAAAAGLPAWDLEAGVGVVGPVAVEAVVAAVAGGEDKWP